MSDMVSIEEELLELRRENSRLRREQEQQGIVRVMPPEITAVMPMQIEMKELLEAVMGKWPEDFVKVDLDMFAAAFRALATIHRQENLDSSHSAGHWVALANQRLHGRGETNFWPFWPQSLHGQTSPCPIGGCGMKVWRSNSQTSWSRL
jgi:hypothetical protein